ncbi:MAG: signal peptidase II [Bdellovibrionia bacterium]
MEVNSMETAQPFNRWKNKYVILIGVLLLVIASDQWTKQMILEKFKLGESLPLFQGYFDLTYVQNKGAAFGLLAQADPAFRVPFFMTVPVIALGAIASVFRKLKASDAQSAFALALIISGAIGNLVDRIRLGFVVDFLDFHWGWQYHFPAFNIADSAICIGVGWVIFDLSQNPAPESHQKGT